MRLNKYIATHTGMSRREVDKMITAGEVKVDSEYPQLGQKVEQESLVEYLVHGKWQEIRFGLHTTILMYKPVFTLTSRVGEFGKKTIFDALPKHYANLKPAGRLDYMSEGLMVLSTDGDLLYRLTHPKHNTTKKYLVGEKNKITEKQIKHAFQGMQVDDYMLNSVIITPLTTNESTKYSYLNLQPNFFWYTFELTEGRNNQIRKMSDFFNNKVLRLIRIQHGMAEMSEDLKTLKVLELEKSHPLLSDGVSI